MKTQNGITLIALVITIIILLILAGVSFLMLTGENGIITQTINSDETFRISQIKEVIEIWKLENNIDSYVNTSQFEEPIILDEKIISDLKNQGLLQDEEYYEDLNSIIIDNTLIYGTAFSADISGKIYSIDVKILEYENTLISNAKYKLSIDNINWSEEISSDSIYIFENLNPNTQYTIYIKQVLPNNSELNITKIGKTGSEPENYMKLAGSSHIVLNKTYTNESGQQKKYFDQFDFLDTGYTIATRVRVDRTTNNKSWMGVYGGHSGYTGILMQFYSNENRLQMYSFADFTPYNNKWVDWVQTYDPNTGTLGTQVLYADGIEVGRSDYEFKAYSGDFFIGKPYFSDDRRLVGEVTSFRCWDVPLSADEVKNIDLDNQEVSVNPENLYLNIDLTDGEDILQYGTIIGTGHTYE